MIINLMMFLRKEQNRQGTAFNALPAEPALQMARFEQGIWLEKGAGWFGK